VPAARLWGGLAGDAASIIEGTVQRGAQAISVHHAAVDVGLVHAARLRGLTVFTWTVDEPSDQARVAAAGVAGICTNLPDVLREALKTEQYAGADPATAVR
jgi:glycerophosphoryl diester phosphodiesterase